MAVLAPSTFMFDPIRFNGFTSVYQLFCIVRYSMIRFSYFLSWNACFCRVRSPFRSTYPRIVRVLGGVWRLCIFKLLWNSVVLEIYILLSVTDFLGTRNFRDLEANRNLQSDPHRTPGFVFAFLIDVLHLFAFKAQSLFVFYVAHQGLSRLIVCVDGVHKITCYGKVVIYCKLKQQFTSFVSYRVHICP